MDKRIKELAHQAGGGPSKWYTNPDVLEYFAELIVRECLSKIENEASQYAEPVWAFELVSDIKDHFGIE